MTSSSSSTSRRPAPTRRWPTSLEIAAVKVKGGKITDRWSTLVNPGRPIVGNQMHGITDADVKKAPKPADAAKQALDVHRRLAHRRPFGRLRPRLPRGRARRRHALRAGPLPRHADDRPRGLSRPRELQAADAVHFFGIELAQAHRALPDAEATANLLIWFGNDLPARIAALREGDRRRRSAPTGPVATARPCSRPPAARRASARACSTSSTRRPPASSPSTRASGWTAAA